MTASRLSLIGLLGWLALVPAASAGISLISSDRTLQILAQSGPNAFINQNRSGPATGPYSDSVQQSGPSGSTEVTVGADQDSTVTLTTSGGLSLVSTGHGSASGSLLSPAALQLTGSSEVFLVFSSDVPFHYDASGYVMADPNATGTHGTLLLHSGTASDAPPVFTLDSGSTSSTQPQTFVQHGTLAPGVYTLDARALAGDQGGTEDARFVLQFTATPGTATVVPLPPAWAQCALMAALAAPFTVVHLRRNNAPRKLSRR